MQEIDRIFLKGYYWGMDIDNGKNKREVSDRIKRLYEDFLDSDRPAVTAMKIMLILVAGGGVIFIGAAAPGFLNLFKLAGIKKNFSKKQAENSFHNLKRRKFIEVIKEKDGKTRVLLTNKGWNRVREFSIDNLKITKPKKWDKKWRVIMFDIPTKPKSFHKAREALRFKIKELGFKQIQKSVWAYPYPCEDELLFVAETYNVQKYVEIMSVDRILHHQELIKKFKLSSS